MSLTKESQHPWARPGTAPTADEVDAAMREVPEFDEIIAAIKKKASCYEDIKQEERNLLMDDTFHDITDKTGLETPSVKAKRKVKQSELDVVDKKIKGLMNNYLRLFYQEYIKYSRNELRMWSFPMIVWRHYQQLFCEVAARYDRQPNFELDECFESGNVVQDNKWNEWARNLLDDFPPSLVIYGEPKYFRINQKPEGKECPEWETCMVDGHGNIVQMIYHVFCGPRLCGTRVGGGPESVCDHQGHAHQFTKRPTEWRPQQGWIAKNPYRYNHVPKTFWEHPELHELVQVETWKPYYECSALHNMMSEPDDFYDRERYQEFYDFEDTRDIKTLEWMDAMPKEMETPVVGTPIVQSPSVGGSSLGSPNSGGPGLGSPESGNSQGLF